LADIRRIPNHAVEAAAFHDFRKGFLPVEDVDAVLCFLVEEGHLIVLVEVGADERVAALDIAAEVGEDALAFLQPVSLDDLCRLAF